MGWKVRFRILLNWKKKNCVDPKSKCASFITRENFSFTPQINRMHVSLFNKTEMFGRCRRVKCIYFHYSLTSRKFLSFFILFRLSTLQNGFFCSAECCSRCARAEIEFGSRCARESFVFVVRMDFRRQNASRHRIAIQEKDNRAPPPWQKFISKPVHFMKFLRQHHQRSVASNGEKYLAPSVNRQTYRSSTL